MRFLFIGDIVAKAGRQAVFEWLPELRRKHRPDVVLANAENAAGGSGLTPALAEELFAAGVAGLTLGNHAWDKREIMPYIDGEKRLIRPLNYPGRPPGLGWTVLEGPHGVKFGLVNVLGRVFAGGNYEDPFRAAHAALEEIRAVTPLVIVDVHGEATSEKIAMGWYLDGRATLVVGTHTHVQTADELILPGGTAFLTDVGMTGPWDSVIGVRKELVLEKFLTQLPVRFEAAKGPRQLCAVVVDADGGTGLATHIERVFLREDAAAGGPRDEESAG